MSAGTTMERVYLDLKAKILAAEFPPGTRLGPAELAKQMSASPTPVRDALYRLSGERVVESWHLEGFRLPLLTETGLQQIYGWAALLLSSALRGRSPPPMPAGRLIDLPVGRDYPEAVDSLFRTIASECENRELRYAIVNIVERTQAIRVVEARVDLGARDMLTAMEEDYRFGRWTALRSKITSFHRRRASQAGRIVAALRPRSDALG